MLILKIEKNTVIYVLVKSKTARVLYLLIWHSISLHTVMQNMRKSSGILFLDSKSQE
jgi:hypothetical protein